MLRTNPEPHEIRRKGDLVLGVPYKDSYFANQVRTVGPIEEQVVFMQYQPRWRGLEPAILGENHLTIPDMGHSQHTDSSFLSDVV